MKTIRLSKRMRFPRVRTFSRHTLIWRVLVSLAKMRTNLYPIQSVKSMTVKRWDHNVLLWKRQLSRWWLTISRMMIMSPTSRRDWSLSLVRSIMKKGKRIRLSQRRKRFASYWIHNLWTIPFISLRLRAMKMQKITFSMRARLLMLPRSLSLDSRAKFLW